MVNPWWGASLRHRYSPDHSSEPSARTVTRLVFHIDATANLNCELLFEMQMPRVKEGASAGSV